MASLDKLPRQFRKVAATFPVCAGLAVASGQHAAASPLCLLLDAAEKQAMRFLVEVLPTIWSAAQDCPFDWSSVSVVQLVVTCWHIVGRVLGAA